MALFKFRKGGDEPAATRRQPESIEAMRQRARHRLIGAGVLVLIGVVGFPLLFDTQPRPIAVDIPIEIPDRNKVKPLSVPAQPGTAGAVSGPVTIASAPAEVKPEPKVEAKAEPKPEAKPEPKVEKVEAKPEPKVVAKAEPKPEPKPEPKAANDGAKAQALLEGKPVEPVSSTPAASEGRFVVQVGAFADPAKARETRLKVEHAGLKTYTHVAETKEGKRIRVRVGPFGTRAEADKAAEKIKGLDLPAAILTL